ncbi:flagellar hook-length control protein FliK [Pseudomonas aeruginosa]|uniref:flagellar hook-length control protein FliK n=1 Tax=Pseudomonas aeruginosa group TaxID=136841 RepID=UPI0009A5FEF3|nr:flagellar hook-length control protein FliK [Pseudomonas aeruginosa]
MTLKLVQTLAGLLGEGDSGKAEVLAVKEGLANNFQVLLKLTLANSGQSLVEVQSNRPLVPGNLLNVSATSNASVVATLLDSMAGAGPLTSLDLEQLPPGTLLQGKVLSSTALPPDKAQQVVYRVLLNLLNTPLAGSKLSLDSPQALPVGSLLTALVRNSQQIDFLPLSGRLDQLALGQQLVGQNVRQASLEGLFAGLHGLAGRNDLPDNLRQAVERLFAGLPDAQKMGDAKLLGQALQQSGLFLEARLMQGATDHLGQDLKANLLRLFAQLAPPQAAAQAPGMFAGNTPNLAQALPAFVRNALGNLGQSANKTQALNFPLPSKVLQLFDEDMELESLLRLAAAAISRLQTHQLSSLAQTSTLPDGTQLATWQMEVPMRHQHSVVPLQVKFQEEQRKTGEEVRESLWRVELAFDLEPLGPLHAQATLLRGSLSSQLWAERDATARLVEHELGHLRQRLRDAGLTVGEITCQRGRPPQGPRATIEQRWVDETA